MIPGGIPTIYVEVKGGMGGLNHDSIPVVEDLGGAVTGYLRNGTPWVRIVNPVYPGIDKYRKVHNGTTWVSFDIHGNDFIAGQESWCELSGHLYEIPPIEPSEEYEIRLVKVDDGWKVKLIKV